MLCESFYFKESEEYTIDWLHLDFCNKIIKEEYQNKADIEAEVNNYQEFRKNIKDWLDKFPLTKYREFKKRPFLFILNASVISKSKKIHLKIIITHGEKIILYIKNILFLNSIKLWIIHHF